MPRIRAGGASSAHAWLATSNRTAAKPDRNSGPKMKRIDEFLIGRSPAFGVIGKNRRLAPIGDIKSSANPSRCRPLLGLLQSLRPRSRDNGVGYLSVPTGRRGVALIDNRVD
ncbi:hypothetical protein FRZ61_29750 [Hypericibacter adhaerens]|uniref:Uncharacterized protein n=1 Tax=Hypericibacter adhaerens TaxID=2602016 RepID=A0A5J6N3B7_9PROT|nr:hypothetical protein FRZ61_29750 [Hypericibacter adhaerens]